MVTYEEKELRRILYFPCVVLNESNSIYSRERNPQAGRSTTKLTAVATVRSDLEGTKPRTLHGYEEVDIRRLDVLKPDVTGKSAPRSHATHYTRPSSPDLSIISSITSSILFPSDWSMNRMAAPSSDHFAVSLTLNFLLKI